MVASVVIRLRAVLYSRLPACRRNRLLRRRIRGPITLEIDTGRRRRLTVPADRLPRFRLRFRDPKVQRFGDLRDRVARSPGQARQRQAARDGKSAFTARDIEQPLHGVVHRPGERNPARIGQRLERVRLAGRNARMHPDLPLPDDHRYLHAASVRNASRSR